MIPDYPSRSYQHQAGYRTVPWDDWVGMRQRALELQTALRDAIAFICNTEAFGREAETGILQAGDARFDMEAARKLVAEQS